MAPSKCIFFSRIISWASYYSYPVRQVESVRILTKHCLVPGKDFEVSEEAGPVECEKESFVERAARLVRFLVKISTALPAFRSSQIWSLTKFFLIVFQYINKITFLRWSLIVKSQQNKIELVVRPGSCSIPHSQTIAQLASVDESQPVTK